MKIIFAEPNCCIKCRKELPYWTLTPVKCSYCWSTEISDKMIENIKKQINDPTNNIHR